MIVVLTLGDERTELLPLVRLGRFGLGEPSLGELVFRGISF
jgi:hypothetical protein